jgi:hypothetical protein
MTTGTVDGRVLIFWMNTFFHKPLSPSKLYNIRGAASQIPPSDKDLLARKFLADHEIEGCGSRAVARRSAVDLARPCSGEMNQPIRFLPSHILFQSKVVESLQTEDSCEALLLSS